MGNKGSKKSKGPEYRYVAHGIEYLENKKQGRKKSAHKKDESIPVQKPYVPGRLENSECKTLMVSSDWTDAIQKSKNSVKPEWLGRHDVYPFENVVMSGGGSKGYAYIGALKALEDAGVLDNVTRVAGSSAGAICGGLLAVGCSPQEIADVFKGDIKWIFQDQKCACCCCLPKLFGRYGVHPGKRFHKIYGQHLARKVGNPDVTFAELKEKWGRELCIVVTNLSKMCSEYCHANTTPDLPIRTAVRMSMSFPMVYEAVKCEINGQTSLYTDGGTLDQYPVHCFDGPSLELNHNIVNNDEFNEKTLGLYVVSEAAIDYKIWNALFGREIPYKPSYLPDTKLARQRMDEEFERRKRKHKNFTMKEFISELKDEEKDHSEPMFHYETCDKSTVDIRSFKEYFVTTIETLLISQRKLHIKPDDAKRTIAINCGYMNTNDYEVEPGDREFLIRQGYAHTSKFLKDYVSSAALSQSQSSNKQTTLTKIDESPSRDLPQGKINLRNLNSPSLRTADEINARLSVALADFEDLKFIDSGDYSDGEEEPIKKKESSDLNLNGPIKPQQRNVSEPTKMNQSLNLDKPIQSDNASRCSLNGPIQSGNGSTSDGSSLNEPIRSSDGSRCSLNGPIKSSNGSRCSLNEPIRNGDESRCSLNGPIKSADGSRCILNGPIRSDNGSRCSLNEPIDLNVTADVHCDNEPLIEPDLRTSLSDCSQPISNSDTVDSGIHISPSEDSFHGKSLHSPDVESKPLLECLSETTESPQV